VAYRSPARNCSLCLADDLLQRRAVGHSDGDRLTGAWVKQRDGHTDLPQLNSPQPTCRVPRRRNVACARKSSSALDRLLVQRLVIQWPPIEVLAQIIGSACRSAGASAFRRRKSEHSLVISRATYEGFACGAGAFQQQSMAY
jgi:hypothetical protein